MYCIYQRLGGILIIRNTGTLPRPRATSRGGGNKRFTAIIFEGYLTDAHLDQADSVLIYIQRIFAAQIHGLR